MFELFSTEQQFQTLTPVIMCTQIEIKIRFSSKGFNEATQNGERIISLSWKMCSGEMLIKI